MSDDVRPYDIQAEDGIPVDLPSGATYYVLTDGEEHYLRDKIARYLNDNHFVNVSDMQDIDRMITFELLIHRWSLWLSRGKNYWNEDINTKQFSEIVQDYCVDYETEILTRHGWMNGFRLEVGEEVLTLNDRGMAEWQPVEAIHRFTTDHVIEIHNRDHWSVTTPHHRWPVRRVDQRLDNGRRGLGPMTMKPTETLDNRDSIIVNALGGAAREPKWSDAFVELVAWYWTEGTGGYYRRQAVISQSHVVNSDLCGRIEAALTTEFGSPGPLTRHPTNEMVGPLWNRVDLPRGITEFRLGRNAARVLNQAFVDVPRKVVDPFFLTTLTQAQLELFIEVGIHGDGWHDERYRSKRGLQRYECVSQRDPDRARSFEIACILAGRPVRTVHAKGIDMWLTRLTRERACVPLRKQSAGQLQHHYGSIDVWCPQIANGTWMARRGGFSYFTGNSREVRQLKKALGVDKSTRDRTRGDDSVAAHWDNLLSRAREFGYMRNNQYIQVITSFQRIKAMITLHKNTDAVERKENACELEDVVEVVAQEIAKFDAIDEKFRFEQQRLWIRAQ